MNLTEFLVESNMIEGIVGVPQQEVDVARVFLDLPRVEIDDLCNYVAVCAPHAELRRLPHQNVRVGYHVAPPGGEGTPIALQQLLTDINANTTDPWSGHVRYEMLHPFTDGNGRSGRLLWLWHMRNAGKDPFAISFLHRFYYQTLDHQR